MEHINGFGEASRIDHSVSAGFLPNPNFFDTFANSGHRFEVVGPFAILHSLQLSTRVAPVFVREVAQGLQGVTEKPERLHVLIISIQI